MEGEHTLDYIKSLLAESPESKIILLGKGLSDSVVLNCLFGGASGHIEWKDTDKFFNKLIYSVQAGEAWFSRRLVGLALKRIHA